jgi:hypothetical protein
VSRTTRQADAEAGGNLAFFVRGKAERQYEKSKRGETVGAVNDSEIQKDSRKQGKRDEGRSEQRPRVINRGLPLRPSRVNSKLYGCRRRQTSPRVRIRYMTARRFLSQCKTQKSQHVRGSCVSGYSGNQSVEAPPKERDSAISTSDATRGVSHSCTAERSEIS